MKRRLPSLLAMRYFESVGRNLSFTLAANELCVTQAAVSHQIRTLEEDLGVRLFTRLHQRIELTAEGLELLDAATDCLDRLADTVGRISGRAPAERIRLSITPLLSARWLVPRLRGFLRSAGNTEILMHHSLEPPNEREPRFDLKVFFSVGPGEVPDCDHLFTDRLVPMCSRALVQGPAAGLDPAAVAAFDLVHEFNHEWWGEWCARCGLDRALVQRGIVLDDPAVLETAALSGNGLILGSSLFLRERLETGALVLPFGAEPGIEIRYHLVTGNRHDRRSAVTGFRRWLLEQGAETRARLSADAGPASAAPCIH